MNMMWIKCSYEYKVIYSKITKIRKQLGEQR